MIKIIIIYIVTALSIDSFLFIPMTLPSTKDDTIIKGKIYQKIELENNNKLYNQKPQDIENEFSNWQLIYEGEFKNGIIDGIGRDYYNNGSCLFEGEFKNGKRNGKGKEYYLYYGNLIFEGEYKDGFRHGRGKEYYFGKLVFEGEYQYGYRIG